MQKELSTTKLKEWISNFSDNDTMPFITTSALIDLEDLELFISKIKAQKADSVRIYFLRFGLNDTPTAKKLISGKLAKGCKWHEAEKGLTQATIAMVPAKNFKLDKELVFSADDIILGGNIHALLPGIADKGTGLNPPSSAVTTVQLDPETKP